MQLLKLSEIDGYTFVNIHLSKRISSRVLRQIREDFLELPRDRDVYCAIAPENPMKNLAEHFGFEYLCPHDGLNIYRLRNVR